MNEVKELRYSENIIVAFLDILGFSNLIESNDPILPQVMKQLESNRKFTDSLRLDPKYIEGDWIDNKREYIEIITNKRLSVLSDSIVISYPFTDPKRMIPIIRDLRNIQLELLTMGILVRGSITMGELYHKDGIIYGPALIKAVYLEEQEAIHPRIIIDNDFYKIFINACDNKIKEKIKPLFIGFPMDDFNPSIDFLSREAFDDYFDFNQIENQDIKYELNRIKRNILSEYRKIRVDYSIKRKYDWFIKYYNHSLKINDYELTEEDKKYLQIDLDRL